MLGDATTGLELWASPAVSGKEDNENVVAAAARLTAEFASVQDGVRALQESLAKVTKKRLEIVKGRGRDGERGGGRVYQLLCKGGWMWFLLPRM